MRRHRARRARARGRRRSAAASRSTRVRPRDAQRIEVVLDRRHRGDHRTAPICWSRPAGAPNVDGLDLEAGAASSTTAGGIVGRQAACAPPTAASMRSATSPAGRIHPRRQLPRRAVIRNALFRLPRQGERRHHPAGDLHRPGTCPCRPDRGAGARAPRRIRVLRWPYHENDRAQAERETRRPHQGRDRPERARFSAPPSSGAHAGELITTWTLALGAAAQYPRFGRNRGALSDLVGDRKARRHHLFLRRV